MDFDGAKAVGGLICELNRLEIAAEGEDDVLSIDVDVARGRAVLPEAQQRPKRGLRNGQHLAQVVGTRLARCGVNPEEAPALAQLSNPVSGGTVEPFDDLCHGPRDYGGLKTA